jgi:hypothetical protein
MNVEQGILKDKQLISSRCRLVASFLIPIYYFLKPQKNKVYHHRNDDDACNEVLRMSVIVVSTKIWKLPRCEKFGK